MAVQPTSPDYPYDQPYWNVQDQNYWCKMYSYGYRNIQDKYLYLIEQGKCNTFEAEYAEYQARQQT